MASKLPTIPRVTFTIIEPISLVSGFIGAIWDPAWFLAEQLPEKQVLPASEHSIVMAQQLGNMYLLMCFVGLAVLTTTSEIKVVRSYLVALWLGDIGHLAFTCLALGKERVMQPQAWNAMTWGNIGFTGARSSVEDVEEQEDGVEVESGNCSGAREGWWIDRELATVSKQQPRSRQPEALASASPPGVVGLGRLMAAPLRHR